MYRTRKFEGEIKMMFMNKTAKILSVLLIITAPVWAQTQKTNKMEKRIINPWKWQDKHSFVQAVEVKHVESTLYISGQTAISAEGISSNEDMESQLTLALKNLEKVIIDAGYKPNGIVRLNIYTTSPEELGQHFKILHDWIAKYGVKQTTTVLGVKSLYETLKVELEATVVK